MPGSTALCPPGVDNISSGRLHAECCGVSGTRRDPGLFIVTGAPGQSRDTSPVILGIKTTTIITQHPVHLETQAYKEGQLAGLY